MYIILLLDTCN